MSNAITQTLTPAADETAVRTRMIEFHNYQEDGKTMMKMNSLIRTPHYNSSFFIPKRVPEAIALVLHLC